MYVFHEHVHVHVCLYMYMCAKSMYVFLLLWRTGTDNWTMWGRLPQHRLSCCRLPQIASMIESSWKSFTLLFFFYGNPKTKTFANPSINYLPQNALQGIFFFLHSVASSSRCGWSGNNQLVLKSQRRTRVWWPDNCALSNWYWWSPREVKNTR